MRITRVLAIASRDWAIELNGRRGLLMVAVALLLLLPIAAAPEASGSVLQARKIRVAGELPPPVAALEQVVVDLRRPAVTFTPPSADNLGQWQLSGAAMPDEIRAAMEGLPSPVHTEVLDPVDLPIPKRSLLIALLAASMLTGALGQTLPGERAARTLEALMLASITRAELIAGKWFAWSLYGATMALLGVATAVGLGRQALGPWMLTVPMVPVGTVALGLWLLRRAPDVVGGATVAIRVLPAALTLLGLVAYALGQVSPWLGAALPLGGALVASGDTWAGVGPPVLAALSTLALSATLLVATARDLDRPYAPLDGHDLAAAWMLAAVAIAGHLAAVIGPTAWKASGNTDLSAYLDPVAGVRASTFVLALLLLVQLARNPRPELELRLFPAAFRPWAMATVVGALLVVARPASTLWQAGAGPIVDDARERLRLAFWVGEGDVLFALSAIVVQELMIRGVLKRRLGPWAAGALHVAMLAPLNPIAGVVAALLLGVLAEAGAGAVGPLILARAVAVYAPILDDRLSPVAALGVGVAGAIALVAADPARQARWRAQPRLP